MGFKAIDKLTITNHAIDQFVDRNPDEISEHVAETHIKTYLLEASTEKLDNKSKNTKKRHHRNPDCVYYVHSGWRFVVRQTQGKFILVTCERVKPIQNTTGYWQMRRRERSEATSYLGNPSS